MRKLERSIEINAVEHRRGALMLCPLENLGEVEVDITDRGDLDGPPTPGTSPQLLDPKQLDIDAHR
ncbi:hypothetical protein Asi02nite_64090 [Asanoa siamensis]|uniref:Uncharacterized protein n=1 Tax=Asanoa siamensis TaxID=926357 RepID=A0ABQ4D015_9ACTN|nr:hypothetical protein Asi02nite_64090 [Asanoa siamensis]